MTRLPRLLELVRAVIALCLWRREKREDEYAAPARERAAARRRFHRRLNTLMTTPVRR